MEQEPPRKPMRPYSIYKKEREELKESPQKIIKAWNRMTEEQKQPYVQKEKTLKTRFDQYRLSLGIPPISCEKPSEFSVTQVKRLCNRNLITKPMDTSLYKALGRATEELIRNLGRELSKRANKKEVNITFEQTKKAINEMKELAFLKDMKVYEVLVNNISKTLNEEASK
eukprot:TRINITY_DN3321_c0_g3_i1.p2 TRINITY_DN3321_c0_g3~~TRINITY_DN3321_c0_g3_i1.p2  ORF type:complete len:170 (+),score=60.75 TRINITY_DN3321_c0_g3_i1:82-591(+)